VAKAKRKASTTQWIALRGALALAVKHYGSTELAKKMLLRDPKRPYRALDDNGIRVEGVVSDLSDMKIDWEEDSARHAFQMVALGSSASSKYEQPSRRLYAIELLRADVPATPFPRLRRAGGRPRQHDRGAIRAVAATILKRGLPPTKKAFYSLVSSEYPGSTPAEGNNREWNGIVGDLYDAAELESRQKGSTS
jgi:hypothetical protein